MRSPLVFTLATLAVLTACGTQRTATAVSASQAATPTPTSITAAGSSTAVPAPATAVSATASPDPAPAPATAPAPAAPGAFDLRIDCGADADYKDTKGNQWLADAKEHSEFKESGGEIVRRDDASPITGGPLDKDLYLTERYGAVTYHIQASPGTYRVILYNCETYDKTGVGDRTFTVNLQGKPVITDYDVCKEAGEKLFVPVTKEFPVTVVSGTLDIEFIAQKQNPEINAIEVIGTP